MICLFFFCVKCFYIKTFISLQTCSFHFSTTSKQEVVLFFALNFEF
jgi:hypothetical protein